MMNVNEQRRLDQAQLEAEYQRENGWLVCAWPFTEKTWREREERIRANPSPFFSRAA